MAEASKQAKHTPGSWTWHHAKHDDGRNNGCVMAGIDSGRAVSVCIAPQYESDEQWQANARLISAAPDLLAVCEQLMEFKLSSHQRMADAAKSLSRIRHAAAAVIGKAMGQ